MLMSARKLFKSATPYYIISIKNEDLYKVRQQLQCTANSIVLHCTVGSNPPPTCGLLVLHPMI